MMTPGPNIEATVGGDLPEMLPSVSAPSTRGDAYQSSAYDEAPPMDFRRPAPTAAARYVVRAAGDSAAHNQAEHDLPPAVVMPPADTQPSATPDRPQTPTDPPEPPITPPMDVAARSADTPAEVTYRRSESDGGWLNVAIEGGSIEAEVGRNGPDEPWISKGGLTDVEPEQQGHGLGKVLFHKMGEELKQHGVTQWNDNIIHPAALHEVQEVFAGRVEYYALEPGTHQRVVLPMTDEQATASMERMAGTDHLEYFDGLFVSIDTTDFAGPRAADHPGLTEHMELTGLFVPTMIETPSGGMRINANHSDAALTKRLVGLADDGRLTEGWVPAPTVESEWPNRTHFVDDSANPRIFAKVTTPSNDVDDPRQPGIGMREVGLAPTIKHIAAGPEAQSVVRAYGFTGVSYAEPLATVISPDGQTDITLYAHEDGYTVGPEPITDADTHDVTLPANSTHERLLWTAHDLEEVFGYYHVTAHNLSPQSFIVQSDPAGGERLVLIDAELFQQTLPPPPEPQADHA